MKPSSERMLRRVVAALLLAAALTFLPAAFADARHDRPSLGATTYVFDPSMPVGEIQAAVDAIHARQVDNEMGSERYATSTSASAARTPATRTRRSRSTATACCSTTSGPGAPITATPDRSAGT
jgi:hypothetical protein